MTITGNLDPTQCRSCGGVWPDDVAPGGPCKRKGGHKTAVVRLAYRVSVGTSAYIVVATSAGRAVAKVTRGRGGLHDLRIAVRLATLAECSFGRPAATKYVRVVAETVTTESLLDELGHPRPEISRVMENAGPDWAARALAWLKLYVLDHEFLDPDDARKYGCPQPHDWRAMGGIYKRAARLGWIERAGLARRENGTDGPRWRSRIWNGNPS